MILRLLVLVLCFSCAFSTNTRGFSPKDLKLIKSDNKAFSCRDASKTIPLSQVNDNYCDCADGSDEPGTPACTSGKFYCKNVGHVPQELFSSRVWDGVCDCCDGSDEETFSTCPNTCQELAANAAKEQAELMKKHTEGVKKKQQYKEIAERELNELRNKIKTLEDKIQQLKVEKEEQEEKDRIAMQQQLESKTQTEENDVSLQEEEIQENDEDYSSDYVEEEEEAVETQDDRNQVREIERQIRDAEREMEDARSTLNGDYGENDVFFPLRGKCFRAETAEYTYELCPFDKVTQIPKKSGSSTSLGKWDFNKQDKWKPDYKFMDYKDGQRCWGGPDRSTSVEILCGIEDEATEPQEPSKCAYSMKLYTPAACDENFAQTVPGVPDHRHQSDEIL